MDEKVKTNLYVYIDQYSSSILFIRILSFLLQLPPEEELKRKQRRDRNKQAAAKCRRKRNNLREELEQVSSKSESTSS